MEQFQEYTDEHIIEMIASGQVELFEILIRRYNPYLYKIGRSYNYGHEDTQDLMQDSFIDSYTHLSKFENRSSFKTWLVKIMLNNCFRKKQKSSFKNEIAAEIDDKSIPMFSNQVHSDANNTIMSRELKLVIEDVLQQIPLDYRLVFSLRELNGLSVKETAEILNISESNVKTRLNRSKAIMRKGIEKSYKPEEIFEFNLKYCDSIVNNVMAQIKAL